MSNHHKKIPDHRPTGPGDRDRRGEDEKMDREVQNTNDREVPGRDLRGKGRQAIEQQDRERDFDAIDKEPSAQEY